MPSFAVEIPTSAGPITTDIVTSSSGGTHPVAILCFDAAGRRKAMADMAERVASWGYVVAVPDLFHRVGDPFSLLPPGSPHDFQHFAKIFDDADLRAKLMGTWMASATNNDNLRVDATAVLDWLDQRPEVRPGKAGVFGYCLGGNSATRIAGLVPHRISAMASFHGGGIVTGQPTSAHKLVPDMKCEAYFAFEDAASLDATRQQLGEALATAKVPHEIETYAGTQHGFAVVDHPTYDPAASERHFTALHALLARALK